MRSVSAAFLLAALLSACAATRPAAVTFLDEAEPVALAAWRGAIVVARDSGVEVARGGASSPVAGIAGRPLALAATPAALYVGTTAGLFMLDASATTAAPFALPETAAGGAEVPVVTALAVGADGRLWAGTNAGAFVRDASGMWTRALDVSPVTALAAVPDGTVWVGSHIGLFRSGPAHDGTPAGASWVTYAEEGTVGASVPDNVIDALAHGRGDAVWVASPTATAIVSGDETEPRTFAFLGQRGGVLFDAAALGPGTLLATSAGPLYLPTLAPHDNSGLHEIFSEESVGARALSDADLATPAALRGAPPTRLLAVPGGTVWLASRRGVWPLRRAPSGQGGVRSARLR